MSIGALLAACTTVTRVVVQVDFTTIGVVSVTVGIAGVAIGQSTEAASATRRGVGTRATCSATTTITQCV